MLLTCTSWALTACGDNSEPSGANAALATTTVAASPDVPCAGDRLDCTSEEVVATVEQLYGMVGATPSEALCLARITGEGKAAVSQAFEAPTEAETAAAIDCVGSEARLREIAAALGDYFASQPGG